jgi:hypothetical protein
MGNACKSCSIVARSVVDNQYFVLYVPTVGYCVCCDISAGLIRPTDLYATRYMSLFFDMRLSTFLIPLLQCPIMPHSLQAVCMYGITLRKF